LGISRLVAVTKAAVMAANDSTWVALAGSLSPAVGTCADAVIRQRHGGRRILVVDDHTLNLKVARIMLEDTGLVVDTAEDGGVAVAMAWQVHYALILMDLQMPNVDGLDATRQIREIPGYRQTPIIAMTANASAEAKPLCLEAGMSDFMSKPFDADLLFATLLYWLSQCDPQRTPR
jgi:CheY-like chemotaxis protein